MKTFVVSCLLVACGGIEQAPADATASDVTQDRNARDVREASVMDAAEEDVATDVKGDAPPGTFWCDNVTCKLYAEYCFRNGFGPNSSARCVPLPAQCLMMPSCNCPAYPPPMCHCDQEGPPLIWTCQA